MDDVSKLGFFKSRLGYKLVDWFVDGVLEVESRIYFFSKNTSKDILKTEEKEKQHRDNKICQFCEKEIIVDKFRDRCHFTVKYRGPTHQKRNFFDTIKHSNFTPFAFHNFGKCDCHILLRRLVDKKNDKVNFDIIPRTNEEYSSVTRNVT